MEPPPQADGSGWRGVGGGGMEEKGLVDMDNRVVTGGGRHRGTNGNGKIQ